MDTFPTGTANVHGIFGLPFELIDVQLKDKERNANMCVLFIARLSFLIHIFKNDLKND